MNFATALKSFSFGGTVILQRHFSSRILGG
jgi:hypothetical protein